jgi:hypothetical protein
MTVSYIAFNMSTHIPQDHLSPLSLLPQSLQLLHDHVVRIQKPINTLPHAWLLVFVQLAILDVARRYALSEACIGEGVYRCDVN